MSFAIYLTGVAILIGGVAWGLVTAGMDTTYVIIASIIMLGIGVISGVSRTRTKDQAP